MDETATYSVIFTGNLIDGFELDDVQQAFSELFKLSPEKAATVLRAKRTLKKDLSHSKAQVYKNKLESIGLETLLDRVEAKGSTLAGLSLVPIESKEPQASDDGAAPGVNSAALEAMETPGIQASAAPADEQEQAAEKYIAGEYRRTTVTELDDEQEQSDANSGTAINLSLVATVAGVAVLGAFIWKVIAVTTGYEFSLVAWGIGGAVGYTAKKKGANGEIYGYICGALVLFAILLGKYWTIQDVIQQEINAMANLSQMDEYALLIEQQKELASFYMETVDSQEAMLEFMIDNGYTENYSADAITAEEIDFFESEVVPMFEGITAGDFDYNGWLQNTLQLQVDQLSTWDLVKETIGIIDFLFFFFGIGTAYQLASGRK